ncbi:MAG: hypothetical protein QM627_09355 [Luteolibacter sp.]
MKSRILKFLALLAAFLLVSCVDGHEEYWIEADGSGRAELSYTLPALAVRLGGGEEAIRRKIADFLQNQTAFSQADHSVIHQGDQLKVTVKVAFRSVRDFKKLRSTGDSTTLSGTGRHFRGDISLALRGLDLEFSRTIHAGKAIPAAAWLPKQELENHRLVYIVHLPTTARESNATRTENSGKTLVWDIPLQDALKGPVVTRFKARIPPPPWLLATSSGVFLAILFLIFKIRRKKR